MKVVLDLDKLRNESKITSAEYEKFSELASEETGSLAFSLLIGFGVIAVCCSTIALVPSAITALILGILIGTIGLSPLRYLPKWQLLAQLCILIGALLVSSGVLWLYQGSTNAWLFVTLLLAALSIVAQHGLLMILSLFALSATIGSGTGYDHATYMVMIEQPTLTILMFSGISILSYYTIRFLTFEYQHLAILASRTSFFLVNMGFWIGSLWGDTLPTHTEVSSLVFVFAWALILIGIGCWAIKTNHRWMLNTCAIFAAIHFYTQWFERLEATPLMVLLAGLIALGFALVIRYFNVTFFDTHPAVIEDSSKI